MLSKQSVAVAFVLFAVSVTANAATRQEAAKSPRTFCFLSIWCAHDRNGSFGRRLDALTSNLHSGAFAEGKPLNDEDLVQLCASDTSASDCSPASPAGQRFASPRSLLTPFASRLG